MAWMAVRLSVLALFLGAPAFAQGWFVHEFGALRAYHGDWLAVCADEGAGPCRTVFTARDPGSDAYFDTRVALHRLDDSPDWVLEVMDRGLPAAVLSGLVIDIDGHRTAVTAAQLRAGGYPGGGAVDTVHITDPALVAGLVAQMQAGNRMTLRYTPAGEGDGRAAISLRGVTASVAAITARVLARQE